jgi:sulfur transfer protein SufE
MNKTKEQMKEEAQKLIELGNRLESYKIKGKERVNEVQEQ